MEPLVESRLPTKYGGFIILAFKGDLEEMPHLALISDKFSHSIKTHVLTFLYSEYAESNEQLNHSFEPERFRTFAYPYK